MPWIASDAQIDATTDPLILAGACACARGDYTQSNHWSSLIADGDGLPPVPLWPDVLNWLRWLFDRQHWEWSSPYRVCGDGASALPPEASARVLTVAVNRLGTYMSISRTQDESDIDFAQRLLKEKIDQEQA